MQTDTPAPAPSIYENSNPTIGKTAKAGIQYAGIIKEAAAVDEHDKLEETLKLIFRKTEPAV